MDCAEQVCGLLTERREWFLLYEQETESLLSCGIDEMPAHMQERDRLAAWVDDTGYRIEEACRDDPELLAAAFNRCDRGGLPEAIAQVYDCGQQVFQVINRIYKLEPMVLLRMQQERDKLEEKIKDSNRSPAAQASRYFSGAQGSANIPRAGHFGRA